MSFVHRLLPCPDLLSCYDQLRQDCKRGSSRSCPDVDRLILVFSLKLLDSVAAILLIHRIEQAHED